MHFVFLMLMLWLILRVLIALTTVVAAAHARELTRDQCWSDSGWRGAAYYPCNSDTSKDDYGNTRLRDPDAGSNERRKRER
jgi:hypothetical protein